MLAKRLPSIVPLKSPHFGGLKYWGSSLWRPIATDSTNDAEETINRRNAEDAKEDEAHVKDVEEKILSASMNFVPEFGWTKEALGRGAQSVGYVSTAHSMFPHGPAHLVDYFTSHCNSTLAENLSKSTVPIDDKNRLKFMEDTIVDRIKMLEPHRNSWNDALAKVMNSKLAPKHLQNVLKLSDDICYYAGDRSVDINWYIRRVGVATIYQASEMHWLGNSRPSEESLEDMRRFTAAQLTCAAALNQIPDKLSALFTIAQNIVPLNWKR